jgi:hypothetical protein
VYQLFEEIYYFLLQGQPFDLQNNMASKQSGIESKQLSIPNQKISAERRRKIAVILIVISCKPARIENNV